MHRGVSGGLENLEKRVDKLAQDVAEIIAELRAERKRRTLYARAAYVFGGAAFGAVVKAIEGIAEAAAANGVDVAGILAAVFGGG